MKIATYILKIVTNDIADSSQIGNLIEDIIDSNDELADKYLHLSKLEFAGVRFVHGAKDTTPNSSDDEVVKWFEAAEKELKK